MTAFALLALLAASNAGQNQVWLGVQLDDKQGVVRITGVFGGSPAEAAGINAGTVILKAGGTPVTRASEFIDIVGRTGVGGTLRLRLAEPGEAERDLEIKLALRPDLKNLQRSRLLGKTAPNFKFEKSSGVSASSLAALKGQVVLLDFWATWCRPCMASLPHLQSLHERYRDQGLRVVGVTDDDWDRAQQVVRERGLTYGQVSDPNDDIGFDYLVRAIPTVVLVGRDGKIAEISVGDVGALDDAIARLLQR